MNLLTILIPIMIFGFMWVFYFIFCRCEKCGYSKSKSCLEVHHKDINHSNNSIDNLMTLCLNCHYEIHRKK